MKEENLNSIGLVTRKTGLSPHVIRVWEKRYEAISPTRSEGNQRLYTDKDVARLLLLKKAIDGGRSIGRIATLDDSALREIIRQDSRPADDVPNEQVESETEDGNPEQIKKLALSAIESLEREDLRSAFARAAAVMGQRRFVDEFMPSLMITVGDKWIDGSYRIFHEHFASAAARDYLGELLKRYEKPDSNKVIVSATPPGQLHELGALISSVVAAMEGYAVKYLGANTPLVEVARVAELHKADIVFLSIVYPPADEGLVSEFSDFVSILPQSTLVYVGGGGKGWYAERISLPRVHFVPDLETLRDMLVLSARSA